MAYDVSALQNYVEQNASELLTAAILAPKSTTLFGTQPNVKGPTTINLLANTIVFQDGSNCGFNAAGTTTLSQRLITPGPIKINMDWCHKAVLGKYAEYETNIGAGRETLPFEQTIVTDIIDQIGAENEIAIWQGDKQTGTGNLAFYDGLATIIEADITSGTISTANQVKVAGQTDNLYKRVKDVYLKAPKKVQKMGSIYCSYTLFDALIFELIENNNFHYDFTSSNDDKVITFPGTSCKVIGVPGLEGIDNFYFLVPTDIKYGYDKEDDIRNFKMWFSDDDDLFKFKCSFMCGIQYGHPEYIVVGKPYRA